MERVRLAIPCRVYAQSHIDYVIEATAELFAKRRELGPLAITEQQPSLRRFTCRFREL